MRFDAVTLMIAVGLSLSMYLDAPDSSAVMILRRLGALDLLGLMSWRFRAGVFRVGSQDLFSNLRS